MDGWDCPACEVTHDYITAISLGMLCGRCNQHTGNNHQGHYWGFCKVYAARGLEWEKCIRDFHFCCPEDCELESESDNG